MCVRVCVRVCVCVLCRMVGGRVWLEVQLEGELGTRGLFVMFRSES